MVEKLVESTDTLSVSRQTISPSIIASWMGNFERAVLRELNRRFLRLRGNQFAFSAFDVHNRTEAVVLQFENVVGIIERLLY